MFLARVWARLKKEKWLFFQMNQFWYNYKNVLLSTKALSTCKLSLCWPWSQREDYLSVVASNNRSSSRHHIITSTIKTTLFLILIKTLKKLTTKSSLLSSNQFRNRYSIPTNIHKKSENRAVQATATIWMSQWVAWYVGQWLSSREWEAVNIMIGMWRSKIKVYQFKCGDPCRACQRKGGLQTGRCLTLSGRAVATVLTWWIIFMM